MPGCDGACRGGHRRARTRPADAIPAHHHSYTGAGSIGHAVAHRLADGLTVLVTDRSPQAARHVRDEIAADGERRLRTRLRRHRRDRRPGAFADSVADSAGRVDVLVNNASLAGRRPSTFEDSAPRSGTGPGRVLHGIRGSAAASSAQFMLPGPRPASSTSSVAGLVGVPRIHTPTRRPEGRRRHVHPDLACDWSPPLA
ncbi:SDR family oxidoreductase [Pseudonocardia sp. MCCB 268]|nr:SDR family oxidoreductase [Pseudonocardia cytotoxica]